MEDIRPPLFCLFEKLCADPPGEVAGPPPPCSLQGPLKPPPPQQLSCLLRFVFLQPRWRGCHSKNHSTIHTLTHVTLQLSTIYNLPSSLTQCLFMFMTVVFFFKVIVSFAPFLAFCIQVPSVASMELTKHLHLYDCSSNLSYKEKTIE